MKSQHTTLIIILHIIIDLYIINIIYTSIITYKIIRVVKYSKNINLVNSSLEIDYSLV